MKDSVPFIEYESLSHTEAALVAIMDFKSRIEAQEQLGARAQEKHKCLGWQGSSKQTICITLSLSVQEGNFRVSTNSATMDSFLKPFYRQPSTRSCTAESLLCAGAPTS